MNPTKSSQMKPHRKAVKFWMHNYDAARKAAAKNGNAPVLQFQDGTQHILLPSGQHMRVDAKQRDGGGKARRRHRIRIKRLSRYFSQPA